MNKELLLVLETVANEKDISKNLLFEAMEEALAIITRKELDEYMNIEVKINRITGDFTANRVWHIVSENKDLIDYSKELYEDIAKEKGYNVKAGDIIREPVKVKEYGRIAAAMAKQILIKKIKNFERERTAKFYQNKIGNIVYGEIKKINYDVLIIDLGNNTEVILPKKDLILREKYRIGDKIKACVESVKHDELGNFNTVILSRSSNTMIKALFKVEIPEVEEGLIDIINVVREPGIRSKVTVKSNNQKVDPCGACVGVRGSRIYSIMNELNGEKIDIILWDNDIVKYAINALSPVNTEDILEVNIDENTNSLDIIIKEENLPKAIGKNGINVKLASDLIGWKINILSNIEQEEKQISIVEKFVEALDIDHDLGLVLVEEGIETLEDLAYLDKEELLEIEGLNEDIINELQERAKIFILSHSSLKKNPSKDLINMQDMNKDLAEKLAENNIITIEDLADLSIDELLDIAPIDKKKAERLIIQAREPWFK